MQAVGERLLAMDGLPRSIALTPMGARMWSGVETSTLSILSASLSSISRQS
jgi:hypothetical protein